MHKYLRAAGFSNLEGRPALEGLLNFNKVLAVNDNAQNEGTTTKDVTMTESIVTEIDKSVISTRIIAKVQQSKNVKMLGNNLELSSATSQIKKIEEVHTSNAKRVHIKGVDKQLYLTGRQSKITK